MFRKSVTEITSDRVIGGGASDVNTAYILIPSRSHLIDRRMRSYGLLTERLR